MAFIELDLRSGYLNSHEEVWMILPDEKPPKDGYPVLWLFHGAHQDCSEWVRNSSVERFANERGLAVIMPTMLHSYGMDMKYGADYFSMVTRELWPELHWMFPCLSQKKEKNFVAGASMGGYIAYKWALTCPEQFAKAGGFAGSIDIVSVLHKHIGKGKPDFGHYLANSFGSPEAIEHTKDDLFWLAAKQQKAGKLLPECWMVCGTEDFGYELCKAACERLSGMGLDVTWLEDHGEHNFAIWDRYIEPLFDWLGLWKGGVR